MLTLTFPVVLVEAGSTALTIPRKEVPFIPRTWSFIARPPEREILTPTRGPYVASRLLTSLRIGSWF